MGKSALIHNMIKQISKEGGTGTKADSLLGSVFNFADKNNELIENIMTLTKGSDGECWLRLQPGLLIGVFIIEYWLD